MLTRQNVRFVTVILSIALLLSSMFGSSFQLVQAQQSNAGAKEILNNLTDEQQSALQKLNAQKGFIVHPDINIESDAPVDVIIEFKQDPAKVELAKARLGEKGQTLSLESAEDKVEASHNEFKQLVQDIEQEKSSLSSEEAESEIVIKQEYRDAFNGVSMTLPGTKIKTLLEAGLIERVYTNETIQLDLPNLAEEKIEPKMIDSIPQIGVDKLHDENIMGEGIKVGVVDTGIDYNHPDLTNVYDGYRFKEGEDPATVDPDNVKGWDFVDGNADPMEATYEDWEQSGQPEIDGNGNSYYTSHGTHVSGTIAGQQENNVDHSVKGVAPGIDLYNYRVLGPYGTGDMDWVIGGVDKAVRDGMDVINLSLGAGSNDPLSPVAVAVNNAMLSDVVTVIASGNAGPNLGSLGTPGAAALPITVGASDVSQKIPTYEVNIAGTVLTDLELFAKDFNDQIEDFEGNSYAVEYVHLGDKADYADKDVAGKVVLIERGELAFVDKITHAAEADAAAAIIYNNEEGQIPIYLGETTDILPTFRLSKEDGEQLKTALEENDELTFGELSNTETIGDNLAEFSSRGPVTTSYDIKPDVTAPGVSIYSTFPAYMNDPENNNYDAAYGRSDGTSMAAPHVAGSAALILQENPDYTPFQVKTALMNTSVDLREEYSVFEVGAGRINVYDATHTNTLITVEDDVEMIEDEESIMITNETGSIRYGSHYLTENETVEVKKHSIIENNSKEEKTYTIEVDFLQANDSRQDAADNGVELDIPQSITLAGEANEELNATIQIPANAAFGTYEGYIRITNADDASDHYQVPFAVRVSDKGIDYAELDRQAVTNERDFSNQFLNPIVSMFFKLKSPMETINIIVNDPETGEALGVIGVMEDLDADVEYFLMEGFMGYVYLFEDDPENPISFDPIMLPEGDYIYELIGTDSSGEVYTNEEVIVVDNTPPELTFNDYEPGVIELDDSMFTDQYGHYAFWMHMNVYDSTIDLLNSKGLDYDQSENLVAFFDNSPFPGVLGVESDGLLKVGIEPEDIENGPMTLDLIPVDLASNANMDIPEYSFIKKGSPYGLPMYDKDKLELDDELTMTMNLNNVEQLTAGEFEVEFDDNVFSFEGVSLNDEFKEFAEEHDVDVDLQEPSFGEGFIGKTITVGAAFADESFEGYSGDGSLIDLKFKVIRDDVYKDINNLNVSNLSYQQHGETDAISIPAFYHDSFTVMHSTSTVNGVIHAEAFMHDEGFTETNDYEAMGVEVYAKLNDKGEKYKGTVEDSGEFTIKELPISEDDYTFYVEVPGHLTTKLTENIAKEIDGELVGQQLKITPNINRAGDVNGDGVIDIHDVMRIVAQYGKEDDQTDINKDGIVDEIDIRYVEENFLSVGDTAGNKKPLETLGPKGINDFLQTLGLEPK